MGAADSPAVKRTIIASILGVAVYESVALETGWVPTITSIMNAAPLVARLAVLGAAFIWSLRHFRVI